MLVGVSAATGNIATVAIPAILAQGHRVRALVHSREAAQRLHSHRVEAVPVDLLAPLGDDLFAGVDRALLITPVTEHLTDMSTRLIDAANKAGVSWVVRVSIDSEFIEAKAILGVAHAAADEHLKRSGLRHTILRPSGFMHNLLSMAPMARNGAIVAPTGSGAVPFIDAADIAACAVAVLSDATDAGGPVDITGPEALTFAQIAEKLTTITGHLVEHLSPERDAAAEGLRAAGFEGWLLDAMLDDTAHVASGVGATVRTGVQQLTGRSPRTLDDFLAANVSVFQ